MALETDRKGWIDAEHDELMNHIRNRSWTVIDRSEVPRERNLVKMTWAYKIKRSGKLKARLCVQGCTQVPGKDYDQSHCSTIGHPSLRTLASLAAKHDMHMRRWDFTAAYLQGGRGFTGDIDQSA